MKTKEEIKTLSAQQPKLRAQRKQNFEGDRVAGNHGSNRDTLRTLYIVYDFIRGKDEKVKAATEKFGYMKNGTFSDWVESDEQRRYNVALKALDNIKAL